MDGQDRKTGPETIIRDALAAAFFGAGVIHVWAAVDHAHHIAQLVFFVVVAATQLWWAGVVRWVREAPFSVLWAGAAFNTGVLVVWIVSRTMGIPEMGRLSHGGPLPLITASASPDESVGVADATASLLEIGSVAGVWLLSRVRRADGRTSAGRSDGGAVENEPSDDGEAQSQGARQYQVVRYSFSSTIESLFRRAPHR